MILSKFRIVSRTEARLEPRSDTTEPLSPQSCSFWTWQCEHSCAVFGGAFAPAPDHSDRGANTKGKIRSREVPEPAMYVRVVVERLGIGADTASVSSSTSSSTQYHRRAETHAQNTHAPLTIVRVGAADDKIVEGLSLPASSANRTVRSPGVVAGTTSTGADMSSASRAPAYGDAEPKSVRDSNLSARLGISETLEIESLLETSIEKIAIH
jgi:hypothetical protein